MKGAVNMYNFINDFTFNNCSYYFSLIWFLYIDFCCMYAQLYMYVFIYLNVCSFKVSCVFTA